MKTFKIGKDIQVVCNAENTRSGFRHLASLVINGNEVDKTKCCYLNRTWEAWEFQSVIESLIGKTNCLTKRQKTSALKKLNGNDGYSGTGCQGEKAQFKTVAGIARLWEIFAGDEKGKNDWKKRILSAGLENSGLQFPENWDQLDEETKRARLDGAIKVISE